MNQSMENTFEMQNACKSECSITSKKKRCLRYLKQNLLVVLLILSLVIGISLGVIIRQIDPPFNERQQMYLKFPGEIMMNVLKLLTLPLIVCSLISGMTSLDPKSSGKIGIAAIIYYLATTVVAVVTGLSMVLIIRPGERGGRSHVPYKREEKVETVDTFLDLLRQVFPSNIAEACFSKMMTKLKPKERNLTEAEIYQNKTNKNTIIEYVPELERVNGTNMLGLVTFSIALGIAINKLGERGNALKACIQSLCDATMFLVSAVIWYSPIGVLFLVAAQIVSMESPETLVEKLGYYTLTVITGMAIHGFISLPLLYFIVVRSNPFRFMFGILQAMFTALGTSSSSATLPITMKNLRENNNIDPRVISFVTPVGATINMDGTALYEAVAVVFIGQLNGLSMDLGKVVATCLTATALAIGAAGVPGAGLVTVLLILTAIGFPTDDIGLLLAIDWLMDRLRTMINVMGDSYGAGIVQKIVNSDLAKMDHEPGEHQPRR